MLALCGRFRTTPLAMIAAASRGGASDVRGEPPAVKSELLEPDFEGVELMKRGRFPSRGRWLALLVVLSPLLAGAECSSNTVAQSAATTAANAFVTQLVNLFFTELRAE